MVVIQVKSMVAATSTVALTVAPFNFDGSNFFWGVGMFWPQSHARKTDTPSVETVDGVYHQDRKEGFPHPSPRTFKCGI